MPRLIWPRNRGMKRPASFFRLPKLARPAKSSGGGGGGGGGALPTHVFKYSSDGSRDFVVMGIYDEGAPNTTGSWQPLGRPRVVDNGAFCEQSFRLCVPARVRACVRACLPSGGCPSDPRLPPRKVYPLWCARFRE
jgi:hypothetical protein